MNNSITILDRNNQSITVDLICYFSLNNKKYIFYNKNEMVQDGLIKMYVSEENNGMNADITQEEWNSLKKVMQDIITGNSNVQFISYSNPVVFNEPKVIALNDTNINSIKAAYKNVVNVNVEEPVLNKDILTQNFGNNTETSTIEIANPIQMSSIPNVQNNFNMESTPVNMNMNMDIPAIEPINSIPEVIEPINPVPENVISEIPSLEPMNSAEVVPNVVNEISMEIPSSGMSLGTDVLPNVEPISDLPSNNEMSVDMVMQPLNINAIKPGGIDSGFKVSNEPNIFDNPTMPFSITEEDVNSTVDDSIVVSQSNSNNKEKIFEINNRRIKLFEELAQTYKEENELLGQNSTNLEKTASNMFDNNGSLNIY